MISNRLTGLLFILVVGLAIQAPGGEKPTYWTLKLKADERLPDGKMAVVGGKTNPIGVHFSLGGVNLDQPVSIQLVTPDPAKVLEIRAFKDSPSRPLVTKQTDEKGIAQLYFRTGETMYFRVTGNEPEMSDYQLAACVGPPISLPTADYFDSPKEMKTPVERPETAHAPDVVEERKPEIKAPGKTEKVETSKSEGVEVAVVAPPSTSPAPPATPTRPVMTPSATSKAPVAQPPPAASSAQSGVFQLSVLVLLALIFVALVALVIVLLRKKSNTAAMLLVGTALLFAPSLRAGERVRTVKLTKLGKPPPPGLVSREGEFDPTKDFIVKNKATYDNYKKADASVRKMITNASTIKKLLEYFDIIDGKEKLVMPNLSPRGMPKLPSSYKGDRNPTAQKMTRFHEINDKIQKAHKFLENNYVVYKKTMITTGRIKDLQKAAANMNSIAQLALVMQGDSVPAEKVFYNKYDGAVENGLDFLDKALKEMSEFEEAAYGFDNWYVYHGIHFYNFMLNRYTRK